MSCNRGLLIGIFLGLASFHSWTLWNALNPEVSEKYRAYFIDGTERCWKTEGAGALTFEEQMPFGFGKPSHGCSVLRSGWNTGAIPWGTQSTHPESTLSLRLESDAHRQATLRFFVRGHNPLQLQTVSVFQNDDFVGEWSPGPKEIRHYDLSVDFSNATENFLIHFLYGHPLPASWAGEARNAKDQRWFGIELLGIDWINPDSPEFEGP